MICGITGGTPNLGTHIVKRDLDEKIQWLIGHLENVLDYSMLDEEIKRLDAILGVDNESKTIDSEVAKVQS